MSDPGYRLIAACAGAGLRVEPVPGPSAALAAVVASGLPTDRIAIDGFLPRRGAARTERLRELADQRRTTVLFVAPHRAAADLADLADACGDERRAVLCRELTKLHEEIVRGTLSQLRDRAAGGLRGELTLVLAPAPPRPVVALTEADLVERVRGLVATGVSKKRAIAEVAVAAGRPKREVYQAVVDAGSTG